jgi:hypothetical protein
VPNWTPQQQTLFTLAMLPSLGACASGSSAADLERQTLARINDALRRLEGGIGNWTVVWGPAIATVDGRVADHVMFVARRVTGDAGLPEFVVAIAGTNMHSLVNLLEDADVGAQEPWQIDKRPAVNEKIARGTHSALAKLKDLTPQPSTPGAGRTLMEFLATLAQDRVTVNICGHSLGGALAATLALWLHDTGPNGGWNSAGNAVLSVLAIAGPSAGNLWFAGYSNLRMGPQVTRLVNPLDVIPLHWNTASLETITNLYSPLIPPDQAVRDFVKRRVDASLLGGYTQIDTLLSLPQLPPNDQLQPPQKTTFDRFLQQMGYQHVDAYFDLLQIPQRKWIAHCDQPPGGAE